jgi:hypothetical protein
VTHPGAADADLALSFISLASKRDEMKLAFPRVVRSHSLPPAVLHGTLLLVSLVFLKQYYLSDLPCSCSLLPTPL